MAPRCRASRRLHPHAQVAALAWDGSSPRGFLPNDHHAQTYIGTDLAEIKTFLRLPHVAVAPVACQLTLDVDLLLQRPHEDAIVLVGRAHDTVRRQCERPTTPRDPATMCVELDCGVAGAQRAEFVAAGDDGLEFIHHLAADSS